MNLHNFNIHHLESSDWPSVSAIYLEGIQTGHATFEQMVPSWDIWDQSHLKKPRLVAEKEKNVVGWAALSPVSGRCIYSGVCEVSVYVTSSERGKGLGRLLLENLIKGSENENIWTLQAGIFPENEASVTLHKCCGFREVGIREKIGKMNGYWRNVILLERRSKVVDI